MKKLYTLIVLLLCYSSISFSQWTNDPLINSVVNNMSGSQAVPHVAYDASGNFYVGFYSNDAGNYDIRLQYYNFAGIAQWASGGILVSGHTQNSWVTEWDLTTDNTGNCVLAFNDVRDGNANVYAYSISPSGSFLWGTDGIQLTSDSQDEFVPSITVTSSNNAIVAWARPTATEYEVVMQKITPSGTLSWGNSGIIYSGTQSYTGARVLGVDGDNYLMGYYRETGNFPALTRHIYVQKFDGSGNAVWASDALASNSNGISAFNNFTIASDNANGIILAWTDDRNGDNNIDAAVQRVLSDGSITWPNNGSLCMTSTSNSNQNPQILGVNSNDEVLVTWSKKNGSQSQTAIAGQKFSPTGVQQWTNDGIAFVPMSADIGGVIGGVVYSGTNAIISYDESVGGTSSHIKAIGVDDVGALIWNPTITFMAGRSSSKVHTISSKLYSNQMIVVWEEGSASDIYMQNIYTDGSMGDPPISDDATLSDLTVNSTTVEGFSPDVYNYNMPIPTGDPLPITDATTSFPLATKVITQATSVPGQSTVLVTAEDGTTQLTYVIDFYVAGTDATISDLTVDGTTIPGFAPDIFNYDYSVATGDPIPVLGATASDPLATMTINQATALPGAGTVVVTSEDGITTNTYTVNYLYTPGTDATLADLLIAGVTIDGFAPDVYNYTYAVVFGSAAPYVQGIPNDPLATIDDTQCLSIPGDAILVVTAEDGITSLTYTVSFFYMGNDATLSDLTVDGTTIPGFDPNITNYQYVVDDIAPIPVVDGTTSDPLATLTTTQAFEIPGDATLHIVAEDGVTELTYTVHFYTLAGDATLSDLTINATTIIGFEPLVTEYEFYVPEGDPIPVIDGTPNDSLASMEITQAVAAPGEGTIVVTAQDGINQMTYTVVFKLTTGIDEGILCEISIYPIPAKNKLYINGIKGKADINIINLLGKKVISKSIVANDVIELNQIKPGIYFAVFKNENNKPVSIKFIKE